MTGTEHPYLAGRKYRADEIGEAQGQRDAWRRLALLLCGLLGVAVVGLLVLGMQPKHIPVLVHWDRSTGEFASLVSPLRAGEEPVSVRRMLREFVTTLREIPTDGKKLRDAWSLTQQRLTKEGKGRLVSYEAEFKPLTQKDPVSIEIVHTIPITKQTWQVRWDELTYEHESGGLKKRQRMVGAFTYQVRPPRTLDEITANPGGIWWHDWSFSPE